ncbi:MAG: tape measure protein, partial [Proteobacteria bacterium]|nr:tape measure protein [Pseudomonadota bacterium]
MAVGDQSLNFRITANGTEAVRELRRFGQGVGEIKQQVDQTKSAAESLATSFARLGSVTAGAFGVREVLRASDAVKQIDGRLKIFEGSADRAGSAFKGIFAIAQESGSGLENVADLYGRFARNAGELGLSQERVLGLTRTISQAMATAGGASASAEAAIMQFGQALGAGVLRGEELNSVLEQAPALAEAIAKGMGRTTGELKAMGEQGLITVPQIISALEKMRGEIEAQFSLMPQTAAQGFARLRNEYLVFVRDSAAVNGAVNGAVGGLSLLAKNFDLVATAAGAYATVVVGRVIAAKVQAAAATFEQLRAEQAARVANAGAAQEAMRRAAAEQQSAQMALSAARAATASAQAQVAADRARLASTAALIRGEIELEKTRLAAQINDIGRAARLRELAALSLQLAATQAAEAKVGQGLVAVRAAETAATEAAAAAKLSYAGATNAAAVAAGAAATGARFAGLALAALGGPIGALITLLSLAGLAWVSFGNKAETAADKAEAAGKRVEEALARRAQEKKFGAGLAGDFRQDIARIEALVKRDEALLEANSRAPVKADLSAIEGRAAQNRAALEERRRALAEIEDMEGGTAQRVGAAWRRFMEDRSFSTKAEEDLAKFNELSKAYVAAIESIRQKQPGVDPLATPEGVQALDRYKAKLQELQGEIQKTAIASEEKLRDALVSAMQAGTAEAQKLKAEIASLLQQAANIRSGVAGAGAKAQDRRDRGLTDDERESLNTRRANDALSEAERMSTFAQNAQLDGRAEKAQAYAERAAELIKQASDYADRLKDDSAAASLFDRIAEAEASALEAQAAAKQRQVADIQAAAAAQAEQLTALEKRIAALKGEAATVTVQANVESAKTGIDEVKAKIDALPDRKVIQIEWASSGEGPRTPKAAPDVPAFAAGGWTGPG